MRSDPSSDFPFVFRKGLTELLLKHLLFNPNEDYFHDKDEHNDHNPGG